MFLTLLKSCSKSYIQGQYRNKCREYFYYIDHVGQLFLDDSRMKNFTSCFKGGIMERELMIIIFYLEIKFLEFFLSRLKLNDTENYQQEFPYLSLCGRERNYLRCDDLPVVFTHLITKDEKQFLTWGYAGDKLRVPFEPEKIFMDPKTCRIYHPGLINDKLHGVGLVRSKLAIEFGNNFIFENDNPHPKYFKWEGKEVLLTNEIEPKLQKRIRHPLREEFEID